VETTPLSSIANLSPARIAPPETTRSEASLRILVVEDDPNVRDMLSLLLGTRWSVRATGDPVAALNVVRQSPPDLVISDLRMPGMDGIALLRRLREEAATRDVPVILVSGRAGEQETIAGLEAGADDFLVKPFSARELLVRVQSRLEVTAMRRRNAQQQTALETMRRHTGWTERLLDSLLVPLLLLEPGEGRVLFANRATVALFGTRLTRGRPIQELANFRLPDEDGGGTMAGAELAPSSSDARIQGRRLVCEAASGTVWVLADSDYVPQLHDHRPVAVLTLRDITRLVKHEEELRRTVHLREEFLSVASHELRTPITTLGLQTETLLRRQGDRALSDELRRKLVVVRNQVLRLDQLVNVLLDVSRLMAGRLVLTPESVDLVAVVKDAVELLRDTAERAGCAIAVAGVASLQGHWDRLRLGQVVTNLLSNAIKFGHGHPIEIEVERVANRARLVVQDCGVGVPPEAQERIFLRFERASSDRHYPGLGLGLWISKEIVEASRGTISVRSWPGQGSTFTVELPLAP
jgi:signal transduction histidine kinase